MTDKEYIALIKERDAKELINDLVYYGCDMYYYDLWKPTIKEIARRLKVSEKDLEI